MDLKEKNVKSIFDEIGFMNNKRLGRCFQTRRKKYYFDTGTGKVFEVNSNVYYILQKILDNADKVIVIDFYKCIAFIGRDGIKGCACG